MTVPTGNRPALCTVPRGARSICLRGNASSAGDGTATFYVGGTLANARANDVSVAKYSAKTGTPTLSVESTTTHTFEIWALCSLQADVLIAGTRTRDLSHIRLLGSGDTGCVASHVLGGRVISLHVSSAPHVLAVTSGTLEMFELSKGGNDLTPTLREDSYGNIDNTIYECDEVVPSSGPIVAGGFIGTRAYAVHSTGILGMVDPREKRTVRFAQGKNGLSPERSIRASAACAFGEHYLAIASEHGDLIAIDVRRTDTPAIEARGAHSGWISALGAVSASAGGTDDILVSGGADGVVKLWDDKKLSCVATLPHHADSVYGVARGDGFFATVSYEGRVAVNTLRN